MSKELRNKKLFDISRVLTYDYLYRLLGKNSHVLELDCLSSVFYDYLCTKDFDGSYMGLDCSELDLDFINNSKFTSLHQTTLDYSLTSLANSCKERPDLVVALDICDSMSKDALGRLLFQIHAYMKRGTLLAINLCPSLVDQHYYHPVSSYSFVKSLLENYFNVIDTFGLNSSPSVMTGYYSDNSESFLGEVNRSKLFSVKSPDSANEVLFILEKS